MQRDNSSFSGVKWPVSGLLIRKEIRFRYVGRETPDKNAFNELGDKGQISDGTV